eukprot:1866817-Ditylum_brightwellii.AAC.2
MLMPSSIAVETLESTRKSMPSSLKISNAYIYGKDEYPKTLVGAHKLLTRDTYDRDTKDEDKYEDALEDNDVAMAIEGAKVLLNKRGEKIICFTCDGNHYATKCPTIRRKKNQQRVLDWKVNDE